MDDSQEFRLVLEAIRDRRLDPALAAELLTEWSPSLNRSFVEFLASRGLLPDHGATTVNDFATVKAKAIAHFAVQPTDVTGSFRSDVETQVEAASTTDFPKEPPGIPSGRYEPIRLHRTGGLGQVWLARDTVLGREVALKVVRPDRAETLEYVSRFVREAQVTGRLEHPGIVPLYDLIEADRSRGTGACYVMRFISGATLAEAVAAYHDRRKSGEVGPLELRGLLDAFIAVCQAVAFAHSRGVLHRDLKGQNVVLGDFGEVFLLDWGLNKGTGDHQRESTSPFGAGDQVDENGRSGIVGTPAYMAPEVAAGNPSSKASDVYGLGAILYSILTGKPPAAGPTPEAILNKVRSGDPTPPRAVNPSTSVTLEAVCRKAMARDPSSRYASAEVLAADVRRWLADEPVSACKDPWTTRASRWARRHKTGVAAAAVMLMTTVVGLSIGSLLLFREQKKTAAEAVKTRGEWVRAEKNLDAAHLLTIHLIEITEKVLPPVRGSELARRDLTRAAVETFQLFAEQRPDSVGVRRWNAQLNRYEANLHRFLDEITSAEASYQTALTVLRADRKNPDRLAQTLRDYASLQARTGQLKEALATLDEAATLAQGIRKVDPASHVFRRIDATILLDRSVIEANLGHSEASTRSADRAIGLLEKLLELKADQANPYDPLLFASALMAKAASERERVGYEAAAPLIKDARARARALIDSKTFGGNLDDALCTQALIEIQASRTWLKNKKQDLRPNAETNLGLVVTRFTDLNKRHPEIPLYRGWLARSQLILGEIQASRNRSDEARKNFEAARIELDRLAADYPRIPMHRADLGRIHLGLSRLAAASGNAPLALSSKNQAIEALKSAVRDSPDDVDIRKSLDDAQGIVSQ
jgi:tetratricopeptide (TPR) repeat protein